MYRPLEENQFQVFKKIANFTQLPHYRNPIGTLFFLHGITTGLKKNICKLLCYNISGGNENLHRGETKM